MRIWVVSLAVLGALLLAAPANAYRCGRRPLSYWLANPLLGDDVPGAGALYG